MAALVSTVAMIAVAATGQELADRLTETYAQELLIVRVEPATVVPGGLITIRGAGFGDENGSVAIGSSSCEVLQWGPQTIVSRAPADGITGKVTVTAGGESVESIHGVTVASPTTASLPTISTVSGADADDNLLPGDTITVQGTGFGETEGLVFVSDHLRCATSALYPPADCESAAVITSWSDTEIVAVVPDSCEGTGYVSVVSGIKVLLSPSRYHCPES